MPYGPDGANPRNMRTQCENVDVENQNTVRTGHTSDPLLKVVEWIAWLTEVSYFHVKDVIDTFYTDWSKCHWIRAPYPLRLPLLLASSASASAGASAGIFWLSIICIALHWLILPWWRNGLVVPPLLVGQTITTPTSWGPTGKEG